MRSYFTTEVKDKNGKLKFRSVRNNLTTDTASGYTNRRDWQSKAMGLADVSSEYSGTLTGSSATTATKSTAAFPTSGQALSGRIIAVGANSSGTGSTVFGVIKSNTATVITVDQWYNAGTMAAGTTPNATGQFMVLPGQFPAPYLAVTENATTPAATDTTLTSELTSDGFTRALAVFAHTAAASTYTLVYTYTATGTRTINKEAVFGAVNTTAGGVMPFESAEPNPPTLVSGDTLQQTVTVTVN